jgi:asparagine synthase (glutamine-hydrolysing)
MFAFAIWDEDEKLLHLGRDRFGVKPLYYSLRDHTLAFASELKALNVAGYTDRSTSPVALAEFVQRGYISAPRSIFADVRVVAPGTVCTFNTSLEPRVHVFWNAGELFDSASASDLRLELKHAPENVLLDRVEASLAEAFSYRLVSDVPVGIFLSGGIDSSLVAAVLSRRSGSVLRTFTIGFGDSEFDETPFARSVAQILGSKHVEFTVSAKAALDATLEIPEVADEPIGDSSLVPTLLVSRLARQHVKVALSADGADELFGGYARYAYCARFLSASGLVKGLYRLSANTLDAMPPALIARAYEFTRTGGGRFAAINDKLKKFVRMARARDDFDAYCATASERGPEETARLLRDQSHRPNDDRVAFNNTRGVGVIDRMMHYDLVRYLPGDLLAKVDRASMFVSLEAREPFLDHKMSQLAAALPSEWKIRGSQNKYVLRKLLSRYFPAELFDRPKQGFTAPVGRWLRGPLRHLLLDELSPQRIADQGLLDPATASEAVAEFLEGRSTASSPAGVWFLLQLQQWAGRWLENPARGSQLDGRVAGATHPHHRGLAAL